MVNTTVGNITLDGQFADWSSLDVVARPDNSVSNYQVYGKLVGDANVGKSYVIGIQATSTADPIIAANTIIYLNTDQNVSTGFNPFGGVNTVGAEYYVRFALDTNGVNQPYLFSVTPAGGETILNNGLPLDFGFSGDSKSLEIAIPQNALSGSTALHSVDFAALISNGLAALPAAFGAYPEYTITDPSTLITPNHAIKKVGIVYSATSAALYFGGAQAGLTAYSDLFMNAQHQAEAAGVSYDILTEADLTNVSKLAGYSALIFPDMQNVQSSQVAAITSALSQVVYNYHVPIITAGGFLTNDETGAPLGGNSYANMQSLLGVAHTGFGTATFSVTTDVGALSNPIMSGYAPGELIGGASGQFVGTTKGFYTNTGYETFTGYNQTANVLADITIQGSSSPTAGVLQTTTGGVNTHFATTGLMGDSNLLEHVIQNAVFGSAPSLALHNTRSAGIVASRTDLDQSQFPSEVSPLDANGVAVPGIYDKLIPILQQWKAQYNFVGTYYINIGDQPTGTDPATTNWAKSLPYYQAILATGSEIGNHSYTHLISPPGGLAPENTNLLGTGTGSFTFDYEFGQSKIIEQAQLGIAIAGAAVPGAPETLATSQQIMQYYQSVAGGLTGYVSGGWTGVGAGYPNAFGYLTPTDTSSVYIAPNITFDFTEIEFQKKTVAEAFADWTALFNQLSANSANPVIVWPWHDYGAAAWDTSGTGAASPYSTQLFTDFIAFAAGKNYEFVTEETLAARIAAQQKATITETTSGNVITATVTADPSSPDLGAMALDVVNSGTQVVQNAGSWYAYDLNSIFLPRNGGTFDVTLGTTQDDLTHISALPMRADLLSVTGNGSSLAFAITGDGVVGVHVKTPGAQIVSIQGAPSGSLVGNELSLTFNDGPLAISASSPQGVAVQHNVTITEGATAVASSGNDIIYGGTADDAIAGLGGNDYINGGAGTNTAVYSGLATDYKFTLNTDGSVIAADLRAGAPDGTDTDVNIQKFQFGDGLVLTKDQLGYAVITGTAGNDILSGSLFPHSGQLILGLAGNDTLTAGIGGNTILDGGDGNDTLRDAGVLAAASLVDTMSGGVGNDTYIVTRANDVIIEQPNGGTDTVQTALATYLLPANVENFVFTGTGNTKTTVTGNASDNVFTSTTGWHSSTIDGGANIATGDTVYMSSTFANYAVTQNASTGNLQFVGRGAGAVDGTSQFSNIEFFHFSDGNVLTAAQVGGGAAGGGNVIGTAGSDGTVANPLTSAVAGAVIQGLGGNDVLAAGANNQTLDGGAGADIMMDRNFSGVTLVGSNGNDTFIVNNAGTVITELTSVGGADTVQTTLSSYYLPTAVSNLVYIGTSNFTSTATAAAESITGGLGADTLGDGGFSNVRLVGGAGNDTFVVTSASTTISDAAGIDGVLTTLANYALSGNVENLTFNGTGNFTGTGNGLANIITGGVGTDRLSGGGGADRLIGGVGNDTLTGGSGADTFVFNAGFGKDTVTDFSVPGTGHDILEISGSLLPTAMTAATFLNTYANQVGTATVITIDLNDTITLNNVSLTTLKANLADIHFV